jgi:phosphotransferase system enzyme I (PtsI)
LKTSGAAIDGESNPFLGVRGVRLSFAAPDVFKVQLRALLRAAVAGNLRVMVPMITAAAELERVRALLARAEAELAARGVPYVRPPLGIMIEVPAAALALDTFDVDFASIGSNDLLQYTMAAARDNPAVAPLADPRHPGFLRLLHTIVQSAAARDLPLSLCGDLAAQPAHVPLLLAAGLRSLSMPAAAVGAVKRVIADWPAAAAH